jgi:ankyrin repeat protein
MAAVGFLAVATACVAGPVHVAARDGDLARVKGLIVGDPRLVNATDEHRFTPLHWAAANGHLDVMVFLIDHGADANARNDSGMTPIHLAKGSRKDLLVFLVDHGADPRARSVEGWTALHAAAQAGHKDSVEFLLARGGDVHARCDGPYGTPLTMAASNGRREVAELLLARGADVNARSDDGDSPLHDAASRGHFDVVRLLLNRGADVNARSTSRIPAQARAGNTPLHDAVAKGHEEVVGLLLARGADVGARSGRRMTPLHLAAGPERAGIVRRLLDRGAAGAAFGDDGLTPLHAIAAGGDVQSAELLLERGADVNVRSKPSSLIPLTAASLRPNPWGAGGNTPLHLAVLAGRSEMVKLLLRRKADANARNDLGRTPSDYARPPEMKDLLRQPARD